MKVLITGGTGLLGYSLQKQAPIKHDVLSIYHPSEYPLKYSLPYHSQPADITNLAALVPIIENFKPDAVIHTAAQSSVDWCEQNPGPAYQINVVGSQNIARLCHKKNIHFIYTSSNAVYGGNRAFNSEADPKEPRNQYGQHKVAVEQWLSTNSSLYTVVRPNLMYGWTYPTGRENQVTRTLLALQSNQELLAVSDTWFSPLAVHHCANIIWHLAENRTLGSFNIGGADRTNLYQLSLTVADIFNLNQTLVKPVSVKNSPAIAIRAIDTSFNTEDMQKNLGIAPISIIDGLRWMKSHNPVSAPA